MVRGEETQVREQVVHVIDVAQVVHLVKTLQPLNATVKALKAAPWRRLAGDRAENIGIISWLPESFGNFGMISCPQLSYVLRFTLHWSASEV